MAKLSFENKWVLVTGASSGLGREIALHLADKEAANLIITARREEKLAELKEEIESKYNRSVYIIRADLSETQEVDKLYKTAIDLADIFAVINNAGMTFYGKATIECYDTFNKIININFMALMKLTLQFIAYFKEKGEGAILNVTSGGGLLPLPFQTVYSASKHAAQAFSEGICSEYRKDGLVISTFAPGGIKTEMIEKSGLDQKIAKDSAANMSAAKVAKIAIKAFKKKKYFAVPGFFNRLLIFMTRLVPRQFITRVTEIIYRLPNS